MREDLSSWQYCPGGWCSNDHVGMYSRFPRPFDIGCAYPSLVTTAIGCDPGFAAAKDTLVIERKWKLTVYSNIIP